MLNAHRADKPFGETGKARSRAGPRVARLLARRDRRVRVARPKLDEAALDQRPCPHPGRPPAAANRAEVAGRGHQVAAATMDPSKGDLDRGQIRRSAKAAAVSSAAMAAGYSPRRDRSSPIRALPRGIGRVQGQGGRQVVDRFAVGEHGSRLDRQPPGTRRPPRSAGPPPARGRR